MTQPYQPQYAAPPQYQPPQAQQPQYAPPPAYGYQQPQQGYAPPAPQYGPPQQAPAYGYQPQQGYAPQQQAPAQQPVSASLGDFYNQPSSGWGPSVTPTGKTPDGTQIVMVVAQHITKAHVEHAKKYKSEELDYYRNGMAKLQMKLPVNVAPGTQYMTDQGVQVVADGRAQFILKGNNKDLVGGAIAAAGGNAADPPELGSVILATKTHNRPTQGQPSPVVTFQYWRPGPEAQGLAAQFGITYPDLNTPKPAPDAPAGGGNGGNSAPPAPSAGPAVQQQAAPQPPVTQQLAPQQFGQMPGAATGGATVQQYTPPAPGTYAPAPGQYAPPTPSPMAQAPAQGLPPAPGVPAAGFGPQDPDKQKLLADLLGGNAPVAPPAA